MSTTSSIPRPLSEPTNCCLSSKQGKLLPLHPLTTHFKINRDSRIFGGGGGGINRVEVGQKRGRKVQWKWKIIELASYSSFCPLPQKNNGFRWQKRLAQTNRDDFIIKRNVLFSSPILVQSSVNVIFTKLIC